MEKLSELLNQALEKTNENYLNKEGMKKCKDILEKLSKTDEPALKLYLYLYPICSPLIAEEEFWFIKFKNDNVYDEYDFALDLLNCYIKYKSQKDEKTFESDIITKIKSFKDYKLISTFFSVIKDCKESIIATISYITTDPTFFLCNYEIITKAENIQTNSFILELKRYLEHKKVLLELEKAITYIKIYSNELDQEKILNQNLKKDNEKILTKLNKLEKDNTVLKNDNDAFKSNINILINDNKTMKTDINNLKKDKNILQDKVSNLEDKNEKLKENIQNLTENNNSLSEKVENLNKRLDKIDLRDTIKMSFRYLYKVLKSKFPKEVKDATKIWDQIGEVEKMLSKPEFKRYEFVAKFIEVIGFDKLAHFNHTTHDSTQQKRNFGNIIKYLQFNSDQDLQQVVEFFEKLPFINEFININLLYYYKPENIDNEFGKFISYSSIYNEVFEKNKL